MPHSAAQSHVPALSVHSLSKRFGDRIAFEVSLGLALGLAVLLLVLDGLGWRIVSVAFDRERLITGTR